MMVMTTMTVIMMVMQETKYVSYCKISVFDLSCKFVVYAEYVESPLVGSLILR